MAVVTVLELWRGLRGKSDKRDKGRDGVVMASVGDGGTAG